MDLQPYITDTKENLKNILTKLGFLEKDKGKILNYFEKNLEENFVIFIGGNQISGSISPFMHNFTSFKNNSKLFYLLFDMTKENLGVKEVLEFIENNENVVGANISMPYKLKVYDYLKEKNSLDKSAIFAGAVNTLAKKNGKTIGYNTDLDGIINPIKEKLNRRFGEENPPIPLYQGGNIICSFCKGYVLGAGGASRAVIGGLLMLGVKEIVVFNRSEKNLLETKNHFYNDEIKEILKSYGNTDYKIKTIVYNVVDEKSNISDYFLEPGILVNTLPFGFKENLPKYPIKENELDKVLKNVNLYFDIVYDLNYGDTPLEQYIKEKYKDIIVCNGIDMVIGQAKKGFEMWSKGSIFNTNFIKKYFENI